MTYIGKYCARLNLKQKNPTWECGKTKKLQLCFVHLFYRHLTDKQWHKITFLSLFFTFNTAIKNHRMIEFTPSLFLIQL